MGNDGSRVGSRENQGLLSETSRVDSKDVEEFRTPSGEVYGWYDRNTDEIYLDMEKISPEHPLHEYTHMWDRIISEMNPELWDEVLLIHEMSKRKTG